MQVLQSFKFFNEKNATGESNVLNNYSNGSQLIVQVSGTNTGLKLLFKGCLNAEEDVYSDLAIINSNNFDVSQSVSTGGIYIVNVDGISKVKCVVDEITTGSVTVFGKLGE